MWPSWLASVVAGGLAWLGSGRRDKERRDRLHLSRSPPSALRDHFVDARASLPIVLLCGELSFQIVLELHQILWERHAISLEFIQLLPDQLIDLMSVMRLALHPHEKEAKLCFCVLERHAFSPASLANASSSAQVPGGERASFRLLACAVAHRGDFCAE